MWVVRTELRIEHRDGERVGASAGNFELVGSSFARRIFSAGCRAGRRLDADMSCSDNMRRLSECQVSRTPLANSQLSQGARGSSRGKRKIKPASTADGACLCGARVPEVFRNWPEQVHRMHASLKHRGEGAVAPAPKRAKSSGDAASSADICRWSGLHESLLQRQRTDQAQRDAGMTGMPAGEREQLRAAIAALAAKLGR